MLLRWLSRIEDSFVYAPHKNEGENWDTSGFKFPVEDVELKTADGVRLHGWWAPPPDESARVILWTHGNSGSLARRARMFQAVRNRGWGVLIFDYRGYGKSDPKPLPTEKGLYLDAEAAWDFLAHGKGIDPSRIVAFGVSLGCAPATEIVLRRECAGLILKTPFTSIPDMARFVTRLPLGWIPRHRYDNLSKIGQIGVPLLVVHGTKDRVVPHEHGRRLFDKAAEPKRFLSVEGSDHSEIWSLAGRRLLREMMAFMLRLDAVRPVKHVGTAAADLEAVQVGA